jgi:hypothetical protein
MRMKNYYWKQELLCEVFCVRHSMDAVGYIPGQEESTVWFDCLVLKFLPV